MTELLMKRRQAFLTRCLKYLRYVFNDHFVVVLLFLLGFLLVEYRQLLLHFPRNPWFLLAAIVLAMIMLLLSGRIATYLLPADKHFLLTKEDALVATLGGATKRGFVVHGAVLVFAFLGLVPILLAMGLPFWGLWGILALLLALKYLIMVKKARVFYRSSGLDFERAIQLEKKRQQGILSFFALFTTVRGISTSTRRRAYLDRLLSLLPPKKGQVWEQLYLRAFLRSGDYLGLTLRLVILALISLLVIRPLLLGLALALLFNYLLLFQLLALYKHYDYQYLTALFPVGETGKSRQLQNVLRRLFYSVAAVEVVVILSLPEMALLIAVMVILVEVYLPYQLKKRQD